MSMIYGKIFDKMYEGSMMGSGAHVFAVMGYVISHMQPGFDREEYVHLNPKLLSAVIGESQEVIQKAIDYLTAPDPDTTSPGEDGRRLVLTTPFMYRVVNGRHYREVVNEEDRKTKAALRQARWRARKELKRGVPLPGEVGYIKAVENGYNPGDGPED